ncbi:MAG: NAD(P)/FAD-dependent oxidoreductase [Nitrososphaeria archaeon]|nr:NAD(P)/FAD-dependent oxidoreductase [Nitrososphaeria archaeon]
MDGVETVDVVVIGGGIVGLIAAKTLVEDGLDTVLIEEHEEIGIPEHCAGLFNLQNLERLGISSLGRYIENRVEGAYFYSPSGRTIHIDAGKHVAVVASRVNLDRYLAEEFVDKGGRLILGSRVLEVMSTSDNLVKVKTNNGYQVSAEKVIDAEGMSSTILRRVLKKSTERNMWIPIIQLWIRDHGLDPRYVYIYFEEYLPEFFAYVIPIDEYLGKLGVASRNDLKSKLNKFLKERFPRVDIVKRASHAVYTGRPLWIDPRSNFIPVGDAAGHVKASTGGGVIMGGLIANYTAKIIASELLGEHIKRSYIKEINHLLRELDRIAKVTKFLRSLPINLLDNLFKMINDGSLLREISKSADMDLQFTSLSRIFINPKNLLRMVFKLLT